VGIANRTDFDLKNHEQSSGEQMRIKIDGRDVMPYVIEPSYGIDRILLTLISQSMENKDGKNVLRIPYYMSPYHMAIFPLMKKDNLKERAMEINLKLKNIDKYVLYDESGTIGKRYARQDEVGTPFCITVDYQTLEDNTVTLRNRDTAEQERIEIDELLNDNFIKNLLEK
jgi:glycyl-tRNA synthetase